MASDATELLTDDSEPMDLASLDPAERALIEAALADLDAGRWIEHSVIKADLAAMRAEDGSRQLARLGDEGR